MCFICVRYPYVTIIFTTYQGNDIVTNMEDMEGDAIIRWQRKRFWAPHPQQDGGVQRQGGR